MEVFQTKLGDRPHQKDRPRTDVHVTASQLVDFAIPGGTITEVGLRNTVSVALLYIESWLRGTGAVAIFNLMEDAATAEISRTQLWQWVHHPEARLDDGRQVTPELYRKLADEEQAKLNVLKQELLATARQILDELVLPEKYAEFLTVVAYPYVQ
jgi:malate synthase